MSVKGCKLHYKCIEEIAHFYTKLTAPELTLLLGGTTYMCHCLGKGTTCRPEVKLYYQHRQLQLGFHTIRYTLQNGDIFKIVDFILKCLLTSDGKSKLII